MLEGFVMSVHGRKPDDPTQSDGSILRRASCESVTGTCDVLLSMLVDLRPGQRIVIEPTGGERD